MWAEPHNKNKLEKTTLSRQGIGAQSKEMKDEGLVRLLSNRAFQCMRMLSAQVQGRCYVPEQVLS